MTLYAANCTFTSCTFTQTVYEYCIYTYGSTNPSFKDCIFNSAGKALKVYSIGNSANVTIENCKFTATNSDAAATAAGKTADKAAIEICNKDFTPTSFSFNVTINNCTESGFKVGADTKTSSLYNVEGSNATTVVVDGTTVYSK